MGVFRFRKFEVRNEKSAMKVNTDGVLLGALMTITGNERRLLDIGTGTGTIALMAAQRLAGMAAAMSRRGKSATPELDVTEPSGLHADAEIRRPEEGGFMIDAIDIDEASAEEAGENFRDSPWAGQMHAHRCPLSMFRTDEEYDLIFSNPPFFTETLHSPSERKAHARHADALPTDEIIRFAAARLSEDGKLSLILPAGREAEAERAAEEHGLRLTRAVKIRSSERKKAYRAIIEFSRDLGQTAGELQENVTINMNGKYSEQYLDIVSDFLLIGGPGREEVRPDRRDDGRQAGESAPSGNLPPRP